MPVAVEGGSGPRSGGERGWRLAELARRAAVPIRTIRHYTHLGLLPPPRLSGRTGYYSSEHLERIELIRELQADRRMSLAEIRAVMEETERPVEVRVAATIRDRIGRWAHQRSGGSGRARLLTLEELAEAGGCPRDDLEGLIENSVLVPVQTPDGPRFDEEDLFIVALIQRVTELGLTKEVADRALAHLQQVAATGLVFFQEKILPELLRPEVSRAELESRLDEIFALNDTLISTVHRRLISAGLNRLMAELEGQAGQ
jgi:DNA-binding transcriptional MerR regulator